MRRRTISICPPHDCWKDGGHFTTRVDCLRRRAQALPLARPNKNRQSPPARYTNNTQGRRPGLRIMATVLAHTPTHVVHLAGRAPSPLSLPLDEIHASGEPAQQQQQQHGPPRAGSCGVGGAPRDEVGVVLCSVCLSGVLGFGLLTRDSLPTHATTPYHNSF